MRIELRKLIKNITLGIVNPKRCFRVINEWAEIKKLALYSPAYLARIGREHHSPTVRKHAWILSRAFIVGKEVHFNWHVSVVVNNWGDLAARLGDRVAIAPGVIFIAASGPCSSHLVKIDGFIEKYVKYAPITVKDDAWIGAGAMLLPGVTVGKCSIIGSGAVVLKDVPDYAVVAGVPAGIIGDVRKNK